MDNLRPEKSKLCPKCKMVKSYDLFGRRSGKLTYMPRSWCRECEATRGRQDRAPYIALPRWPKGTSPETKRKASKLRNRYGLSIKEYEDLIDSQLNKCKTCLKDLDKPVVDHCHKTGRVRGILCNNCNASLGLVNEDIKTLERMIDYIGSFTSE